MAPGTAGISSRVAYLSARSDRLSYTITATPLLGYPALRPPLTLSR